MAPVTASCGDGLVAGEKVRTSAIEIRANQALDLGNSQSDGIAADHSRSKRMLLGFEQAARR